MIRSKTCFKCNTVKLLEDFYKHPNMPDGHVNKCKECNKQDVANNRLKNIDRIREYAQTPEGQHHRHTARLGLCCDIPRIAL